MKVNILGTEYQIKVRDSKEDKDLENRFGYCCPTERLIVVADMDVVDEWKNESDISKSVVHKSNIRHEIVHAFFYESGLWGNSGTVDTWAMNEEMIDWIAIQSPKIFKAFQEVECL
ncbi:hypothetical protein [Frisingicoccus sp.]|uniref:hypothetical protein n=1 Tax=Frisingicoccus sp. TaxID=1918627 RepID=UPI0039941810